MQQGNFTELSVSERNYIRAVYDLGRMSDLHAARPVDVSLYNGVTRSSATTALKHLEARGLVVRSRRGCVFLTEKGMDAAEYMMGKFLIIESFLETVLKVNSETAQKDAWRMEYAVSDQSVEKMSRLLERNAP